MIESLHYLKESQTENPDLVGFLNRFVKKVDAEELRDKLNKLGILKIKPEYLIKIIDTIPETSPDLNKIFVDVSLDEEEIKKILEVTKGYN